LKKKILIAGAGGAPSEGVIYSLLQSGAEEVLGMGSEASDLVLSKASEKYLIPYANTPQYRDALIAVLNQAKPDFVHFQNDLEIFHASQLRDEIHAAGVKTFMPPHDVIDTCVHKYKTYEKIAAAGGIPVPRNLMIRNEDDLRNAFTELGDERGAIWLRASSIGGGGKGALPTSDFDFAKGWINRFDGWGDFVAAEMLSSNTVTWLSIWWEGELIVAQTRIRKGWTHGNRTVSGVTGVTKVGQTYSDETVDRIAEATVRAVTDKPHGIFGVDMTYDKAGLPNPTEINISRFFTTIRFFTEAGLNMPEIMKDLVLYGRKPQLDKIINPLPDGLLWLRGMDTDPKLFSSQQIEDSLIQAS
jgi:hypothetical protein